MSAPRLLIVEDEAGLALGLRVNFELDGFRVDVARSGREAGDYLGHEVSYDAIVLDVMLPDFDGFELCRRLREEGNFVPVIMLTARGAPEDRVRGLEAGADDYIAKPFELSELMARIRSKLRRRDWDRSPAAAAAAAPVPAPAVSAAAERRVGAAVVDFEAREARAEGRPAQPLTQLELDLLRYFADNPGRVVSRAELLEKVWKLRDYPNTRTVDNFIVRLRKLCEPDPATPVHFQAVRGAGYRYVPA